jgi:hypothetical protein
MDALALAAGPGALALPALHEALAQSNGESMVDLIVNRLGGSEDGTVAEHLAANDAGLAGLLEAQVGGDIAFAGQTAAFMHMFDQAQEMSAA